MAFRFVHTGDLHLDSPFVGLTAEAPPGVAATLREATVRAWNAIVELTLAERADFLLVAGDAFERANRTLRGQLVFRDGLARLSGAGIPSFVVTGNHDPLDGWEPSVAWPELAHRFGPHEVTTRPVLREDQEIARIHGISYHRRDIRTNLARGFRREADAPYSIGLLHANVGGLPDADDYAPCGMTDLVASGMDYWALGHIHRHRVLSPEHPTAVYCGNPQGRDPGETDPRGCYLVTVDDSGRTQPSFRAVDVVRWQLLEVPTGDLADEDALVDAVTRAVDEARSTADRSIVARVTLTGRGPLHASLSRPGLLADVRVTAQERLGLAEPFGWIESLRDATRPNLDIEARRTAEDFVGELLRRLDATRRGLATGGAMPTAAGPGDHGVETAAPAPPETAETTVVDEKYPAATEAPAPAETAGTAAVDEERPAATEGIATADELDRTLDDLFDHQRARRPLGSSRPDAARLVELLDQVEAVLLDRLGGDA